MNVFLMLYPLNSRYGQLSRRLGSLCFSAYHAEQTLCLAERRNCRYLRVIWIEDDRLCDVWDDLTLGNEDQLVQDLYSQVTTMWCLMQKDVHIIGNMLGGPIFGARSL
jgi:hypothetical protein